MQFHGFKTGKVKLSLNKLFLPQEIYSTEDTHTKPSKHPNHVL